MTKNDFFWLADQANLFGTHWQASELPRLFLSARGGSLSVGWVVLRSDALARALISQFLRNLQFYDCGFSIFVS